MDLVSSLLAKFLAFCQKGGNWRIWMISVQFRIYFLLLLQASLKTPLTTRDTHRETIQSIQLKLLIAIWSEITNLLKFIYYWFPFEKFFWLHERTIKGLPGPAMPYLSALCERATPDLAIRPFQGWRQPLKRPKSRFRDGCPQDIEW
jgi:hypothetical protein